MNWEIIVDVSSLALGFALGCIFVRFLFDNEIRKGKQK